MDIFFIGKGLAYSKMSFSAEVKKELIKHYDKSVHCRAAELAAIVLIDGKVQENSGKKSLKLVCESEELAKKCIMSFKSCFGITAVFTEEKNTSGSKENFGLNISELKSEDIFGKEKLTEKICCKRAFLRGAFIASGAVSDPEKSYHFEIAVTNEETAIFLTKLINEFNISPKTAKRRGKYIVYLKDGVEIADMLNVTEAHVSLMKFENARILREMRGNVNRKVNCETANINKTIAASYKQIEDIMLISETIGLDKLDDNLKSTAEIRLEYSDISLEELGKRLSPPVGKSGVNHRLRKICQIADDIRKTRENI